MIVVDASILAYMLLPGEHTAEVVRLRERDPRWVAPLLWRSELLNVLWKVVRQGGLAREEALLLMGEADGLLESEGYRVPDGLVLSLAIDSGCTAYDCHYVALAQGLGVSLLTHDKQVLSAFPEVAIRPADYLRRRPRGT